MEHPLRIVVAKPGLDGHDRGAKVVARALRDGGHEVIYTGLRRTPEQIVRTVMDEDARFVGLSSLSGAHSHLFPKICNLLRESGLNDVVVFGGGIIFNPPMRATPTLRSGATYVVNSGNAGTPAINSGFNPNGDGVQMYNSATNWTANAFARLTATFEAEL